MHSQSSASRHDAAMILSIASKHFDPDIAVLEMAGRICLGSASQQVEWSLADLLKQNQKKIVFDLSGVTVLDSTGVGIIVMCYAKVKKAGGNLRIAGANGMVEETLKMTNVDKIMPFYSSLAEATQNFQLA
jgi:anti-sigma B factor antagonist